MIKVAEDFEVSGSYLARICSLLNVPRPPRGYWAMLAVGKAPKPIPLPDTRPGDPLSWSQDGDIVPPPKPQAPAQISQSSRVRLRLPKGSVHGLIRDGREHFDAARAREDDLYLKPTKKLLVDLTCSRECLDKALGFANDVFNAFEVRGHRVVLAPANGHLGRPDIEERETGSKERLHGRYPSLWSPYRPTVVYVGTLAFGLTIVEMSEEVLLRYVNGKYIRESDYSPPKRYTVDHSWTTARELPSGRLRLVAYCPYRGVTWSTVLQETKKSALDGQIPEFIRTLENSAAEIVIKLQEAERRAELERQQWHEQQERWRREEDRRQVDKSIADSKVHLGQIIQQWSAIIEEERFLQGIEARSLELPPADRELVLQRLELAREFLGSVDPLQFFLGWKTPTERYRPR